MKVLKLALAILAALWTLGVVVGVVSNFGAHGGTRGMSERAAGVAAISMCAVITYWLFQWAVRNPSTDPNNAGKQGRVGLWLLALTLFAGGALLVVLAFAYASIGQFWLGVCCAGGGLYLAWNLLTARRTSRVEDERPRE
jgi:hypothetical protein